jgi:acetyl-CoA C-acetyltransferase
MGSSVYIAGVFEHSTREAPDKSAMQLHGEVAKGALDDAGLKKDEVDAYMGASVPYETYAYSSEVMADYLGLDVSFTDTTDHGGASYPTHVGHVASAIRDGKCDVGLVTLAGRPRSLGQAIGTTLIEPRTHQDSFERIYGPLVSEYAMAARRHMHEYGTTSEQLAEIRVAASYHAQFNDDALYQDPVSVEDVVDSPTVADPLHLLDCCVITDGGGAVIVVSEDVKEDIDRECVELLGHGEAVKHHDAGRTDLTYTAARDSGQNAYDEAGVEPDDIDYASVYDSFTITVLEAIEDLGFCEKGEGGTFVEGGGLKSPDGALPFNTDGGGLASNHPANRGGMTKMLEAVRQLRGETAPEVQVPDADLALVQAIGGDPLATRHAGVTLVLGGEDR